MLSGTVRSLDSHGPLVGLAAQVVYVEFGMTRVIVRRDTSHAAGVRLNA